MVVKKINPPFFFFQMSDPQFGMFTANQDMAQETELFERVIAQINRLSPAFVLNTGDLINEPRDERQIAEALRIAQKINKDIPLYSVPGNHDIGDTPNEESLSWYRKRVGKDWYSFNIGGWHFIGLNSCIIHQDQNVEQEAKKQWEWLKYDLEQTYTLGCNRIIIFMHHPLFLRDPNEMDDYFNIPQQLRQKYLSLFKHFEVKVVFAGHLHQNSLATDQQLEMVTTAPVGMPLGQDPSGFRIVKVDSDRIGHKYFDLDDVNIGYFVTSLTDV